MKTMLRLLLLFIGLPLFAQMNPDDKTAQVVAYWDKGETYTYRLEYHKYNIQGVDSTLTRNNVQEITFTVTDSTATSYAINMDIKNYVNGGNGAEDWHYVPGMDLKFVYSTDEMGSFNELINKEYVAAYTKMNLEMLTKQYSGAEKFVQKMNPEILVNSVTQVVSLFHNFYGISVTEDEEIRLEDQNQESNSIELTYDVLLVASDFDWENENYMLSYFETYDPIKGDQMVKFMEDIFGIDIKKKDKKVIENFNVDISTQQHMLMHNSGVPLEFYFTKTIKVESKEEFNQTNFETYYLEII